MSDNNRNYTRFGQETPPGPAPSTRYARHPGDHSSSSCATSNNEMLNRTTTDYLPTFKDQARSVRDQARSVVTPLKIEKVEGRGKPPDHRPRPPNGARVPPEGLGGRHDEADASTLQLQGEDTIDALAMRQQNHPKKAWLRSIFNSLRSSGKRSAVKLPWNAAQHDGIKRATPKFGIGRTNKSKQIPDARTELSATSDRGNTAALRPQRGGQTVVPEGGQAFSGAKKPVPHTQTEKLSQVATSTAMFKYRLRDFQEADDDAKPRAVRRSEHSLSPAVVSKHTTARKNAVMRSDPTLASEACKEPWPLKVIDPASMPMSQITSTGHLPDLKKGVHNDTVKIILLAPGSIDKSWLAQHISCSQPRFSPQHDDQEHSNLTVDVYDWCPSRVSQGLPGVKYSIWDVHGSAGLDNRNDIGFHPAVQSIFFSPGSLYLLVWDMACDNPHCNKGDLSSKKNQSAYRASRAVRADIECRMLPLLDRIVKHFPGSFVLPVALVPPAMCDSESKIFYCKTFGKMIKEHVQKYSTIGEAARVYLLMKDSGNVVCIDSSTASSGVEHLQERIMAATANPKFLARAHVGMPVPKGTVAVYRAICRLKHGHDYVSLDQLLMYLNDVEEPVSEEDAVTALQVISNAGFVHFFASLDPGLSGYIFLNSLWLQEALSCILRDGMNDNFRNVLDWTKDFMKETYEEHEITSSLIGSKLSNCPLLSTNDAHTLIKFMNFIHHGSFMAVEGPKDINGMDCFLERLLVQTGVFIPFQKEVAQSQDFRQSVYFVPCLVLQMDPPNDMWTFMSQESFKTTLCHTWLFREGVVDCLMDNVSVAVLQALYIFVKENFIGRQGQCRRIHQILCFKNKMVLRIGSTFDRTETDTGDARESFVDVFIGVVSQISSHAVATDAMDPGMRRLIVGGKGLCGSHRVRLWKGGFGCIVDSVRELLLQVPQAVAQVVCYECLAQDSPKSASTWDWYSVMSAKEQGLSCIWCPQGHCVCSALLTGNLPDVSQSEPLLADEPLSLCSSASILQRVVLVGVWDPDTKSMVNAGSGFIVDEKLGLIVTAGHILFELKDKTSQHFGKPYQGRPNGRAVIAVIPDAAHGGTQAVFRYFAEIVTHDIPFTEILLHNIPFVDACVLRITAKIEDTTHISALDQLGQAISLSQKPDEDLCALPISTEFQLEQGVRIFGFNQGGEGRYPQGRHISLSADVVFGKICRNYIPPIQFIEDGLGTNGLGGIRPTRVIVTTCPTIAGHSGGPCVTSKGRVIGILSMGDPAERTRSYVVPMSEIQPLIKRLG